MVNIGYQSFEELVGGTIKQECFCYIAGNMWKLPYCMLVQLQKKKQYGGFWFRSPKFTSSS